MIGPRRLACARVAWRQARRAPWRSALAVAMVAIPITALVFASTVIATATTTSEERATATFGTAELRVDGADLDASQIARISGNGALVARRVTRSGVPLATDEEILYVEIEEMPRIDRAPLIGIVMMQSGRPAIDPGEALVHPDVLRALGARVGERIRLGGMDLDVTGTAIRPLSVSQPFAVVAPGTLRGEKLYSSYLVDVPDGTDVEAAATSIRRIIGAGAEAAAEVTSRQGFDTGDISDAQQRALATATSFAITALALAATGLIAAAAFAVGARRQLRTLGLVAAIGGETRDVRAVVLLGGSVLGGLGALIGCALGLAAARAALPHMARFSDALPGPLQVNWPALVGALVLGVLASTGAAFLPARTASKIAPLDALAGRMPAPRAPGKLAWVGVAIFALGFVITPVSWRVTQDGSGLSLGLGALGGGLLLAIPLAVTLVGRWAARLPAALRLAARDVARHGRRTGAALAATTLALSASVLASAAARADAEFWRRTAWLTGEQAMLTSFEDATRVPDGLVAAIGAALAGASVAGIAPAVMLDAPPESSGVWATGAMLSADARGFREEVTGALAIGTPELARALGMPKAAEVLESDVVVALGTGITRNGRVTIRPDGGEPFTANAVEVASTGTGETILPRFLVSPAGARALGLRTGSVQQVLVHAHRAVTDEDVRRINRVSAGMGVRPYVMTAKDWLPASIKLRPIALGLSALFSLLIVGAALAMVSAESRRDRAILSALGAAPLTRRKLAAARAFLLTIVAGIVAVPAGIAPFAAYQWSRPDGYPVVVPWDGISVSVIGVPVLAALSAFAMSRKPSADAMMRPIT